MKTFARPQQLLWRAAIASLVVASDVRAAMITLDPGILSSGDNFGQAVAISDDTIIVGAQQTDNAAGAAYVFVQSGGTWTLQQKLLADAPGANDGFGTFVAVDGDTAIIGAPGRDDGRGSAYVFTRSGSSWSQQQKLEAADRDAADRFGTSVAISGNTAVVGATGDDEIAESAGAAYAFVRTAGVWVAEQKLVIPTAVAQDTVGGDVAVEGDTAIVGATHDDEGGPSSGAAFVFTRNLGVWTIQDNLVADDSVGGELVASGVSLSGDTAVLGAHYGYAGGTVTGAAYVFVRTGETWSQQQKLTAFDGTAHDDFGWTVSVSGDVAVGGGDADDETAGSAHVYIRKDGVWYHRRELINGERSGNFGYAVAASPTAVVVGAPQLEDGGAAYVFDVDSTLAHPLGGDRLLIRNSVPDNDKSNRITLALKDPGVWMPVPGSSTDPTIAGAVLRVESTSSNQVFEQFLPAANWVRSGSGQASASYRYSDRELDDGACDKVRMSGRKATLGCSGKGIVPLDYDLVSGQVQAPVRVTLQFAPGVGYCAEFGGSISRDGSDARSFSAKGAPAPASCD